ncbi:hypothetical protein ACFE04_000184 [Oxalis oulophora]
MAAATATANAGANTIVPEVLGYDNYDTWSACLKSYLLGQDLWDIVESPPMNDNDFPNTEEYKVWRRKNAAALHAILFSCGPLLLSDVSYMSSANTVWNKLAEIDQIPNYTDDDVVDQDNHNNQQSPETDHTDDNDDVVDQDNNSPSNVHSPSLPNANNSGNGPTISRLNSVVRTTLVRAINTGDLE